jgi:hypothetical protein
MNQVIHKIIPRLLTLLLLLPAVLTFDVSPASDRATHLDRVLSGYHFNVSGWIGQATWLKISQELLLPQNQLNTQNRAAQVLQYMEDVHHIRALSAQINTLYSDPAIKDAASTTQSLRTERDTLRNSLNARQPLVEAVLQEQIESILVVEGFGFGGQVLPPVRFQMTQLPLIMIISRRDRIERIDQRELQTGLPVDRFGDLEAAVDQQFDVSSLITPIGGYGTYPTMLPESSALGFTIDTAVHEWTHNYLLPSYVGLNYNSDPAARTINETAAVLIQQEIGKRVLARYYPESSQGGQRAVFHPAMQSFDFRGEMRTTRIAADQLLAAGDIAGAESYMTLRRAMFVENGYEIRKLNQAYFAFYGAYNAEPGGAPAAGRDTLGPSVQALRMRAPTLYAFVRAVAQAHSQADIEQALR